jgi:hypothetical protein
VISLLTQSVHAQTTQWIRIPTDPANTPPGREVAAMVYDEKREVILMHGGRDAAGLAFRDTWEWNGQTWRQVANDGPPILLHGMAYDVARDRTVLYGGRWISGSLTNYMNVGETWEWDGSSWTHIETGSADPLILFTMVYDRKLGRVVRHGGSISGDWISEDPATYAWDGTNWTQIAGGSFVRGAQRATYDSARGKTVMFGGTSITDGPRPPGDETTWEFNGVEWVQVADTGPAYRTFHGLAFDSHRSVTVLYGGEDLRTPSTEFADTWEWDGIQWTEVDVSPPGNVRVMFAMAFDSKRRKVVLFGGSPCRHCAWLNETWEYGLIPLGITETSQQGDGLIEIHWTGEAPPYQLQSSSSPGEGSWMNEGELTDALSVTVQTTDTLKFFRVVSLFGN